MADSKISALTALTSSTAATNDVLPIVDTSAVTTKKIGLSDICEFVSASSAITTLLAAKANLASPTFTGVPAAPTAAADTNTTQVATTGYVVGQAGSANPLMNNTVAVGTSLRYARQDHVHPVDTSRAALASPTFTGTPAAPTAAVDTNTTQIATTAYVVGQGYAKLDSPTFTGTPAAPTAAVSTSTTQVATTAFVMNAKEDDQFILAMAIF